MTQTLAPQDSASALMEKVIIGGDLSGLTSDQRVAYYQHVCASVGLNPLTKPFEYLELDGKLILYARRDCTDQLRGIHNISITRLERERMDDLYVVTAYATRPDGRSDTAVGAVPLAKEDVEWRWNQQAGKNLPKKLGTFSALSGDALANAVMKAETKAKRRVTLSICGLGITDESELDTMTGAVTPAVPSAPARRPLTSDELRQAYQSLVEEAVFLQIDLDPTTYGIGEDATAADITKKGQLLRAAIKARREAVKAPEPAQNGEQPDDDERAVTF